MLNSIHIHQHLIRKIFSLGTLCVLLIACGGGKEDNRIAKVGEYELFETDLAFLSYTKADSAEIVSAFVNNWIEEHILLMAAEEMESIDQTEIDKKVADYRKDLLIHQMETIQLDEKLDTNVTDEEILSYHRSHKEDFQLNDYLVKVLYLKIPTDAPNVSKIENVYRLQKPGDLETVETYAKIYATNFYYDIESWIYFDDLLKEIPLTDINKDRFILNLSKIRFEDNGFYYFVNILDYKLKNSISPLDFERENIKARILNLRIKETRDLLKKELIDAAYDKNEVTIDK
jgi:hypothetical protein